MFKVFENVVITNEEVPQEQSYIIENQEFIKSMVIRVDNINSELDFQNVFYKIPNTIEYLELLPSKKFERALGDKKEEMNIVKLNYNLPSEKIENLSSIKSLILSRYFNSSITINNMVNQFTSLTSLKFGFYFNQIIGPYILPQSLKIIKFGFYFDQIIGPNVLPKSLEVIKFGGRYSQSFEIDVFPQSLKVLKFGYIYNKPFLKNVLPNQLKSISFDYFFNQSFDDCNLPDSIEIIKFKNSTSSYKQRIISSRLPKSLTSLSLPQNYDLSFINGQLPNTVTKLRCCLDSQNKETTSYYIKFSIHDNDGNLSSKKELADFFNFSNIVPPSVTRLKVIYYWDRIITYLPPQITSIHYNILKQHFDYISYIQPSDSLLNITNLKSLECSKFEPRFQMSSIPNLKSLLNLNISNYNYYYITYCNPFKNLKLTLPNLKTLRIGKYLSRLDNSFYPESLELLELGIHIIQPINKKWLPNSIKHIIVLGKQTKISLNNLPPSLESLWIPHDHYQLKDFKFFYPIIDKLHICQNNNNNNSIREVFNKILKNKYYK